MTLNRTLRAGQLSRLAKPVTPGDENDADDRSNAIGLRRFIHRLSRPRPNDDLMMSFTACHSSRRVGRRGDGRDGDLDGLPPRPASAPNRCDQVQRCAHCRKVSATQSSHRSRRGLWRATTPAFAIVRWLGRPLKPAKVELLVPSPAVTPVRIKVVTPLIPFQFARRGLPCPPRRPPNGCSARISRS